MFTKYAIAIELLHVANTMNANGATTVETALVNLTVRTLKPRNYMPAEFAKVTNPDTRPTSIDCLTDDEYEMARTNGLVKAVKLVRERVNCSLIEAKNFVEKYAAPELTAFKAKQACAQRD